MPRRLSGPASVLVVVLLMPSPASAWGWAAHRFITRRAIDILPADIKPFYVEHRDEVVDRSIDPDLWRAAGWDDDPNHFINFGAPELGPYPFAALPREYGAALEKFGEAGLKRLGTLPWREAEEVGNLKRAFENFGTDRGYVILFSGVVAHYIQDATQPLHASNNYDGQLSNQRGVHNRFEAELYERFESRIVVTPGPPKAISSVRDYAFDTLLASHQKVSFLLEADREAIGTKDTYDDAYFEAFFVKVKPLLEERLSAAVTATASVIVSAWEQAGRPSLKTQTTRVPQKVQKAR